MNRSAEKYLFQDLQARDLLAWPWRFAQSKMLRAKTRRLLLNRCRKASGTGVPIEMRVAFAIVVLVTTALFATSGPTLPSATASRQSKLQLFFPRKAS